MQKTESEVHFSQISAQYIFINDILIKKVCMNLMSCFIDDFLFISFSQKNEIKKGKYLTGIHIFTFLASR